MATIEWDLNSPVIRGLACAAITPELRNVLVFDADPEVFEDLAQLLAGMLNTATGREVSIISLGVTAAEDDLWGGVILPQGTGGEAKTSVIELPGLLLGGQAESAMRLVAIPDLTRLSLAAARACVMLMEHKVAYLERHGRHEEKKIEVCWLAACQSAEVGQISPHLLDRFGLRLNARAPQTDRVAAIRKWIESLKQPQLAAAAMIPEEIGTSINQAMGVSVTVTPAIPEAVCRYFEGTSPPGMRRELALARLAIALARLDHNNQVVEEHVIQAAKLIGLRSATVEPEQKKPPKKEEPEPTPVPLPSPTPPETSGSKPPVEPVIPVYEPGAPASLPPTTLLEIPIDPYPEDKSSVERETCSLQLPFYRYVSTANERGPVVGVQPTESLYDLAIISTVFEALKFQKIRHQNASQDKRHLIITQSDLRRYRRAPISEQMLAILVDYTALKHCNWQDVLTHYLRWAYVERARLCAVLVGAADADKELCAERTIAHNVLNPNIERLFNTTTGKATPLAHGLDLLFQTTRHALQHGRGTVRKAFLIVFTDGRGNVPLSDSQTGQISWPVGSKGVESALEIARRFQTLENLKSLLFTPPVKEYKELPFSLAKALGAEIFEIPQAQEEK